MIKPNFTLQKFIVTLYQDFLALHGDFVKKIGQDVLNN